MNQSQAIELLRDLVAIPSHSHHEAEASTWLVSKMDALGYDRAYVDGVGNAVGEMGPATATQTIVLLGHIDTVPGTIPVRIEATPSGLVLYGRGSVDAKGPLATFVAATAAVGSAWTHEHNVRLVVVGAVEEEAATSKGARFIRDRFDGDGEAIPTACIIGEPSGWTRVTLGYKGRILAEVEAAQPMAHTAGPDQGVATVAVDFWRWMSESADAFNVDKARAFDQLLPSLRRLSTFTDDQMNDRVIAGVGVRLPLGFDVAAYVDALARWGAGRANVDAPVVPPLVPGKAVEFTMDGDFTSITLRLSAYEPAWRSDRSSPLVRCFLAGLRQAAPEAKLGFVLKTGTSDMNVVAPAWRCPVVAYGPGDSNLDHTPHEHVALDEYGNAIRVLASALRMAAGQMPVR